MSLMVTFFRILFVAIHITLSIYAQNFDCVVRKRATAVVVATRADTSAPSLYAIRYEIVKVNIHYPRPMGAVFISPARASGGA